MQEHQPERRRRDLRGRVARATWPMRHGFDELAQDLPCRILGHRWVQVPPSLLSRRDRERGRLRFKCARCFLMGGFTN